MQLVCQVLMFLVLFFSILIKAQAGEEAAATDVDSTAFTEKCVIVCTVAPLVILLVSSYLNLVQPIWQAVHAETVLSDIPAATEATTASTTSIGGRSLDTNRRKIKI